MTRPASASAAGVFAARERWDAHAAALLGVLLAAVAAPARASDADSTPAIVVTGGTTTVYQTTTDPRVLPALTASADLGITWTPTPRTGSAGVTRRASVTAYLEGNSTSETGSVAALLPEANTDAGSALDRFRRGRVQLSELRLDLDLGAGRRISGGLVDPSAAFDQSRVASDENTQFLGVAFTGNPTIEFPDYTLGLLYEDGSSGATVYRVGATSSSGLADNPAASYAQLVNVTAEGKGAFLIGSVSRPGARRLLRVGAWLRTGGHPRLDGPGSEANHGAYLLAGASTGRHRGSLRLGYANPRVSQASAFVGGGYQYLAPPFVYGLGLAHTFLSGRARAPGLGPTTQGEGYVRRRIAAGWFVTGGLQWIHNSGFDATSADRGADVAVWSVRLTTLLE